jgi:DUF1680 family protein
MPAPTATALQAVPFTQVTIDDLFWSPRLRANRAATLPAEYRQCRDTGRLDALRLTWQPGDPHEPHIFWDSDVAKWIEAASYSLAAHPDPALRAQLDEVAALVAGAQGADGYLNTHYTVVEPDKRWSNLRDCHELYCAGHLIEAAVAHFQATGSRVLLDALCRYADYIGSVFGTGEGQKPGYCGHEEIELALVKLAGVTGEARYRDQAAYFVNERGRQPYYFDTEALARGDEPASYWAKTYDYCQAARPVRELSEVAGHAVRAMYLYSAMADLAVDDPTLRPALDRLWDDVTLKKLYITGGLGPSRHNEGFTTDFDLPNETAYAETCAAIGLIFWAHRMLLLEGDGRYADVLERALYNGAISGVSLDGERFFYENPLASTGAHHRQGWFDCACCPPNAARLLASLGGYLYATRPDGVQVHLYAAGTATLALPDGAPLALRVETRYPWGGQVRLTLDAAPAAWTLWLRIPGWCRAYRVTVNGDPVEPTAQRGAIGLHRTWQPGDVVELDLAMPIERMEAHPAVLADRGRVALQRGPLVYCVEGVDHPVSVHQLSLPADAALSVRFDPDLLGGVAVIEGEARVLDAAGWTHTLYRPAGPPVSQPVPLRAIPYCCWDNRAPGEMAVWLTTCTV